MSASRCSRRALDLLISVLLIARPGIATRAKITPWHVGIKVALLKAATGEEADDEELGGAEMH